LLADAFRARNDQHAEHAATGNRERRFREVDAVIETIVLAQAACEGWIYAAYRRARVKHGTKPGWVRRWTEAPGLICDRDKELDEPPTRALDDSTVETLRLVSRWRNFLLHGDDKARDRLHKTVQPGTETDHLTAEFAERIIKQVDAAFTDAGSLLGVHGSPGLSTDSLWVALDE
jgi:hypothetical protein